MIRSVSLSRILTLTIISVILIAILSCEKKKIRTENQGKKFPDKFSIISDGYLRTEDGRNYYESFLTQYNGVPDNFHILGLISDPFVLFENGKYRMWFTALENADNDKQIQGVAYSESTDGLLWTDPKDKDKGTILILKPTVNGWDEQGIETVSVVKNPNTGMYNMYYAVHITSDAFHIGLATSADGISWEKYPEAVLTPLYNWEKTFIIPEGAGENAGELSGGVLEPTVLYDIDEGIYKMWYATLGLEDGNTFATWGGRIGYATSSDGINWEHCPEPVFVMGKPGSWDEQWVSHCHVIEDPEKGYHLFYAAEGKNNIYGIGHAYSEDGISWERNNANPILKNDAGSWHSALTGGPSALIKDNKFYLYFFGSQQNDFAWVYFGLATAVYKSN